MNYYIGVAMIQQFQKDDIDYIWSIDLLSVYFLLCDILDFPGHCIINGGLPE